ncbi:MAG: glycoside hydrolase family 127 protein [Isosphaeraceae bacterium]
MTGAVLLLAGGLAAFIEPSGGGFPAEVRPVPFVVPAKLDDVAELLSPSQVHIDGWLGPRIAANAKNRLLAVDTEPLLAGYRKRPGSHPWIGEHVGKWLHAATLAWAYTGDAALRTKLDRVAADLIACQEPDGYLGTYVPEKRFGLFPGADWDVWSHKYNLIGLLTYHQYTGNKPALECCRKMGDLLAATFPARKSILAAGTHVGMASTSVLEPIVLLYRFTGEDRYLEFARYIVKAWDEPGGPAVASSLRAWKGVNKTANGKAYEMMSNLVGLCELARATGDRTLLEPVLHAWNDIVANRLYLTGSASAGEHFQEDHVLPNQVGANVGETCVTTTWIQLNLQLLRLTGGAKFGDELERAFYNHLSAAQHPRGDDWCYYTALEGKKPYDPGINCCHSSGPRGMSLVPQAAYLKARTESGEAVYVSTFETSRARLSLGGQDVVVEQQSGFPREGKSTLRLRLAKPARFAILVRVPSWDAHATLAIDGDEGPAVIRGDEFYVPAREWSDGASLSLSFALAPRLIEGTHGNAGRAAQAWGPFVLAFDQSLNPGLPPANQIGLIADRWFKLLPQPALAFRGPVVGADGRIQGATFVPFADAGSGGGAYRVWLRAPGVEAAGDLSLLSQGEESRSRRGNQPGSIVDGDPSSIVVTYDGKKASEDWFAVTLAALTKVGRVRLRTGALPRRPGSIPVEGQTEGPGPHGQGRPVGAGRRAGRLPAHDGRRRRGGPADSRSCSGSRSRWRPWASGSSAQPGDRPEQSFSSCGELLAFPSRPRGGTPAPSADHPGASSLAPLAGRGPG